MLPMLGTAQSHQGPMHYGGKQREAEVERFQNREHVSVDDAAIFVRMEGMFRGIVSYSPHSNFKLTPGPSRSGNSTCPNCSC